MTLSIISGFDSYGPGLQTSTVSTDSVETRTATVDAVLALSRALKSTGRGIKPALTVFDEFAYINIAPSLKERFVHSSTDRTSWSDYRIEPTIHVVDRNELDKALSCEPTVQQSINVRNNFEVEIDWDAVSQLSPADDEDWSMAESCDGEEDCSEYSASQERMDRLESSLSAMNDIIHTLRVELDVERDQRRYAQYRVDALESKIGGLEARLNQVKYDGQLQRDSAAAMQARLNTLEAETRAKVTQACKERLDSLTAPTRSSTWETICEHPPARDEILSGGDCSFWELTSGSSTIRSAKMPLEPKSTVRYDTAAGDCSITMGARKIAIRNATSRLDIHVYQPTGSEICQ